MYNPQPRRRVEGRESCARKLALRTCERLVHQTERGQEKKESPGMRATQRCAAYLIEFTLCSARESAGRPRRVLILLRAGSVDVSLATFALLPRARVFCAFVCSLCAGRHKAAEKLAETGKRLCMALLFVASACHGRLLFSRFFFYSVSLYFPSERLLLYANFSFRVL